MNLTSGKLAFPPDSIFGAFDLVLCRNVLIYFSRNMIGKVLDRLIKSLAPGGFLILGDSESLDVNSGRKRSDE